MSDDPPVVLLSAGVAALEGAWHELGAWAELGRVELVLLPPPGASESPDADAAERRRLARRDLAALAAVAEGLRGRVLAGVFVTVEEVAGQAGRAWHRRVAEAAERAGVVLPRATRLHPADTIDLDALDLRP